MPGPRWLTSGTDGGDGREKGWGEASPLGPTAQGGLPVTARGGLGPFFLAKVTDIRTRTREHRHLCRIFQDAPPTG